MVHSIHPIWLLVIFSPHNTQLQQEFFCSYLYLQFLLSFGCSDFTRLLIHSVLTIFSFISSIARYMCPVKFRKKWQPVTPMHDVDVRFNTSLQGKDSTLHLGWVFPPQILSHRVLVTNWDHVGPGDYDETPEVNDVHVMYNMSVAVVAWMSTWCCCCCRNLPPQLDMNILSMKIFFSANWKVLSKPVSS